MKTIYLNDLHHRLGAKMTEFSGYLMPLEYSGIEKEHAHVRSECGLFDVSHMGKLRVGGPKIDETLNYLLTCTLPQIGKVKYGLMLADSGGVLDDMLIYKLKEDEYFIIPNAANTAKIEYHLRVAKSKEQYVINQENEYGILAIQGPRSIEVLFDLFEMGAFKRFTFKNLVYEGYDCLISRTGYTGEDGYEIMVPYQIIETMFQAILELDYVEPIGLGARDTLRFEAGLPLYGSEIDINRNPLEAGLDFAVDLSKSFRGKNAIYRRDKKVLEMELIGLELLEKGIMREGQSIVINDKKRGYVTTGYRMSYNMKSYALGYIEMGMKHLPDIEVLIHGKLKKVKVINYPFIKKESGK
jgi:aminomethyltransferase